MELKKASRAIFFVTLSTDEMREVSLQGIRSGFSVSSVLFHCPEASIRRFPVNGKDKLSPLLTFDPFRHTLVRPGRVGRRLGRNEDELFEEEDEEEEAEDLGAEVPVSFFRHPALPVDPRCLYTPQNIFLTPHPR